MASRHRADPEQVRTAVLALRDWLADDTVAEPDRAGISEAVRLTARMLAVVAPGASVEVRVPPFVAVQCISGPRHTRGTPPNIVETDPRTWLRLTTGLESMAEAVARGRIAVSGSRAGEVALWLPLVPMPV